MCCLNSKLLAGGKCCEDTEIASEDKTVCCAMNKYAADTDKCCSEEHKVKDGKCVDICCGNEYEKLNGTCG